MHWIFTHFKSTWPHVMRHWIIAAIFFDFSSMVVFLNTLLLKYYRAHNIHHCTFYPISNVGLGFCYSILKGKFLFIFNIFGEKIGRALIVWLHIRPKLKKYFVCPLPSLHFWVGSVGRKNVLFFQAISLKKVDAAKHLFVHVCNINYINYIYLFI